jgi:PPM family protein phosphatase
MTIGRATGLSHPGRRRRRNEDAWVCDPPIFAIADGMGGARGGEIASQLAAGALGVEANGDGADRVVALIQEANKRVYERAEEDSAVSGMGTTITVALVEDGVVTIGHVGDSRAYLIRDGKLDQLTDDHTLVAELVRSGKLSPAEAEAHPQRSVITRALGTDPDVDVDTFPVETKPGDLFMLCSDGLTSMVGDEAIEDVVEQYRADLDAVAKRLVERANRSGGEDNITVVLFEIVDEPPAVLEQTAAMEAVEEPVADDEDTLSGLEGLTVPEEALPISDTEVSDTGNAPKRRWRAVVLLVLAVIVLLAAAVALYWALYL